MSYEQQKKKRFDVFREREKGELVDKYRDMWSQERLVVMLTRPKRELLLI